MKFHCPLCESEIETEVDVVDGQHVNCPSCEKKFTFYVNAPAPEPQQPVIIASGEDFERYLCDQINELACAKCEMTKASGDQGVDLIVTLSDGKTIAIQCKLYSTSVGNDAVQQVIAGRIYYKCDMAAVVTNNVYTDSAADLANASNVRLLHYTELVDWVSGLGGSKKSRLEAFEEDIAEVLSQHADYETELMLHVKYKIRKPYSVPPEEMLADLVGLQSDLMKKQRRMMRETARLVHILAYDLTIVARTCLANGYFGRALARCYETHVVADKPIDIDTLNPEAREGLARYVRIAHGLSDIVPVIRTLKTDMNLNDQIFRDELPSALLGFVSSDYNVYPDADRYHDIASGRHLGDCVSMMKDHVTWMFNKKWADLEAIGLPCGPTPLPAAVMLRIGG